MFHFVALGYLNKRLNLNFRHRQSVGDTAAGKERLAQDNAARIKADSHIACRAHAAPILFPWHVVPLTIWRLTSTIWVVPHS